MKSRLKLTLVILFLLIVSAIIPPFRFQVDAQEEVQTTAGISVSPIRVQKNYKGNDKDVITFTLLNNEEETTTLSVTLKSFKLLNNNTDISFDGTVEEAVLNWVRNFDNSITLKPKERIEYELHLNIDPSTKPGGYLFGIFFEGVGNNNPQNGTSIRQSIGVPLIINIAGVEGISYGEVKLDTFDAIYNSINNSLNFDVTILNNSNQIIIPSGIISIDKELGIGPDQITSTFNPQGKIINAFSLRTFDKDVYFNQLVLGRYQISLDFLYGLENNVYSQRTTVWVIPIWFFLLLIVIILFLYNKYKRKESIEKES